MSHAHGIPRDLSVFRIAESDRRANGGYVLTPEERADVLRLNRARGTLHLIEERGASTTRHPRTTC